MPIRRWNLAGKEFVPGCSADSVPSTLYDLQGAERGRARGGSPILSAGRWNADSGAPETEGAQCARPEEEERPRAFVFTSLAA